jgi:hypothetical protein
MKCLRNGVSHNSESFISIIGTEQSLKEHLKQPDVDMKKPCWWKYLNVVNAAKVQKFSLKNVK